MTTSKSNKRIYEQLSRKCLGRDGIPSKLLKYGVESLIQLTKLTQKIFYQQRIPNEWRTSTTILMFKKGDKKLTSNYRRIYLLSTLLKLLTKIITNKINGLQDKQQDFRSGRSCTDAVFVLRQITIKSIEYNKPAYICFIDLVKAFDRVRLKDIFHLLYD